MVIGILSDTHDRVDAMRAAMATLRHADAEFFIHCGDIGGPGVIDHLAGVPSVFVWGNTDWDRSSLADYAQSIGVACHGAMADLTLDGKRLAVIHGDDGPLRQKLLAEQGHDYLLQGHTHIAQDQRVGKTRWINPGAMHRAHIKTVAVLDTARDLLRFLPVRAAIE